jgi:putative addiction module killer protein
MKKELRVYQTNDGKRPFINWLESFKDRVTHAQITNRINRLALGSYGDCKSVGDGVSELRIHYGAGYRVYFAEQERTIVLLLLGGNKKTQDKDIEKAKHYWAEFRRSYYD